MKPPPCLTAKGKKVAEYAWRLGLAFAFLTPTASALVSNRTVESTAATLVTVACAGLVAFHLLNTGTRIRLHHWEEPDLAEILAVEIVLGVAAPLLVLVTVQALPPTSAVLISVALAFAVLQSFYERIQKEIFLLVEARPHLTHGTEGYERVRLWRIAKLTDTVGDAAREQRVVGLQSLITLWVGPRWDGLLSRTRTVILYVMLASTSVALGAGVHGELKSLVDPRPKTVTTIAAPETKNGAEQEPNDSADTTAEAPPEEGEEGECTHMPGDGAPEWAEANLNALYLGNPRLNATPPPGFKEGGCTTGAIVPAAGHGEFAFAVGKNPAGEVRSVAVVSRRFEPAIFVAPAAQRVLHRIREGQMPLGGYPTTNVAGGDMTVILTPKGSAVLTRASKHPPGLPDVATPYTEMPPTVAAAFVEAMNERGHWLWPAPPERREGAEVFPLRARVSEGLPDLEVTLDRRTGVAVRGQHTYDPPEAQLSLPELRHHASSAWWVRQEED
ncbi:MAG: hypothetical protein AB7T48_02725 [Solirubrobacterales bacterium]